MQCSEAVWITTVRVAQSTLNHLVFVFVFFPNHELKLELTGLHSIIKSLSVTENSCWLTREDFTRDNLCKVVLFSFCFWNFIAHTAQTLALSLFVDMQVSTNNIVCEGSSRKSPTSLLFFKIKSKHDSETARKHCREELHISGNWSKNSALVNRDASH